MLNKREKSLINFIRYRLYKHNEPADIIRWIIGLSGALLKKKQLKRLKVNEIIDKYASTEIKSNPRKRKKLLHDMIYSSIVFGSAFDEYFLFRFETKNYAERRRFITSYGRWDYFKLINNYTEYSIFRNKYETYCRLKEYYKRDAICIKGASDFDDFYNFTLKHTRFVYKPLYGALGKEIKLIDIADFKSIKTIFNDLIQNGECILEELVVQAPEMAKLNPTSVNTVRMPTVYINNDVKVLYPFLKIGRNNSFVDNGGAGGILALIDLETGIVCDTPMDEENRRYILHPDTGVQIIGFKIPRWDEAVELAKKLACSIPTTKYVGWDIALTKNGWIMIEGNSDGMFVGQQMLDQIGKKDELYNLVNSN